MYCAKGCQRRSWLVGSGALGFEGVDPNGYSSHKVAHRIATPTAMANAYSQMLSKVGGLRPAPRLEFYDYLHGVGGLFIADQWVIAIGVRDVENIAEGVLATNWAEVTRIMRELARAKGVNANDARQFMIGAGMGRTIAHELGHALIYKGWSNPFAPDGEAGADYYAGKFDAARGSDWRLGEMFFRAIGCVGPSCGHPSPQGRSNAYITGYREQQQAA